MTPAELQALLRDFYLDRLALLVRHEAAARFVTDYDINNAYQYVISREETHVSWLQHALLEQGAAIPPDPSAPDMARPKDDRAIAESIAADARANSAFVDKWRSRIDAMTNARHQGMLRVILGEMLEHQRMFEQASEGRTDIIGTPMPIHTRRGKVMETRWVE